MRTRFETAVFSCPEPLGEATTVDRGGSIVETTYKGHVSRALLKMVSDHMPVVFKAVPNVCWLVDLSGMTDLGNDAADVGRGIFRRFRDADGMAFAFVLTSKMTQSISARAMIRAVGVVSRVTVHIAENRDSAFRYLSDACAQKPVK